VNHFEHCSVRSFVSSFVLYLENRLFGIPVVCYLTFRIVFWHFTLRY